MSMINLSFKRRAYSLAPSILPSRNARIMSAHPIQYGSVSRRFTSPTITSPLFYNIAPWSTKFRPTVSSFPSHPQPRHLSTDTDDEWIPPDHSPLARSNHPSTRRIPIDSSGENDPGFQSMEIDEDEIEVIDLEATVHDPSNREYLHPTDSVFGMESTDSDWGEIVRELKEAGEEELLEKLVRQYGLRDTLTELETAKQDEGEDWNDLEQSLRHLPEEEIIDELIENSLSLSQLEMEILSKEMENGLDLEKEEDVKENAAYQEFREMVLDDYYAKLRDGNGSMEPGENDEVTMPASLQYSMYPPDWTDYDSKAAFQRDFLKEDDSRSPSLDFVPSTNRLGNDTSSEDTATSSIHSKNSDNFDNSIDWLQARRSQLGEDHDENNPNLEQKRPTQLLTPEQAETFRHQNSQIPVVPYTLLTTSELSTSLSSQGGTEIHIIDTSDYDNLYGVSLGCHHLMIVTGRNSSHIRVMVDSVVRNMKARKLHERGVLGAMQGPEGGENIMSNKRSRNRASRSGQTMPRKFDDDWMCVDCGNIHVHILEPVTRKCLKIESLWDLNDPRSEGSKLRRIDLSNDDEVDTYVAQNPVPEEYAARMLLDMDSNHGWVSGGAGGRVHSMATSSFNRKSYSAKWSDSTKKSKGRRGR